MTWLKYDSTKTSTTVNTVTAQLHPQFLIFLYSILFLCNNYYITVDYWFIVLKSLAQYIVGKTLDFI